MRLGLPWEILPALVGGKVAYVTPQDVYSDNRGSWWRINAYFGGLHGTGVAVNYGELEKLECSSE